MLFLGLVTFLFLIIIRPQDFVAVLKGQPLVFIVMSAVLTGWCLSNVNKRPVVTAQDKYIYMLFVMINIATFKVGWITFSLETGLESVKLVLIYLFIVTIVNTIDLLKRVIWIIVTLMTIVAAMGVLQFYGYDVVGSGMLFAADKQLWQIRGAGNFNNPNDLAYSVVLTVPFALGAFLSGRLPQKIFSVIVLVISVYCIYLTNSRGGQLALVFSIIIFFLCWVSSTKLKKILFISGIMGVLLAFSIQTRDYRGDRSSMGRVEAWAKGMSLLESNPLMGVGKDQFREYHERDSHNSFVRAGAELGLPGLYAFVGILFFSLRNLLISMKSDSHRDIKQYLVGLISFIGSFAVASIFSSRVYDIIFLIVVALTSSLDRIDISYRGYADDYYNAKLINTNVFCFTVGVLLIWKLFLIQVW